MNASLDELLKEWEAEAKASIEEAKSLNEVWGVETRRDNKILSLIAVVRKQNKGLQFVKDQFEDADPEKSSLEIDYLIIGKVRETLTEAEKLLKS